MFYVLSLTQVVEPIGNLLIHLITYSYSDSQEDLRDESCKTRQLLNLHHHFLSDQFQERHIFKQIVLIYTSDLKAIHNTMIIRDP